MQIHVVRKKEKNGCDMQKNKKHACKALYNRADEICDAHVVVTAVVA